MSHVRLVLLRGRIFRRPHAAHRRPCARVIGIPQFHQAKIDQHRPTIRPDDDVLRLDVPVDDALPVTIAQRIQQLARPIERVLLRQRPSLLDDVGQALSLDKIHHQVSVPALFKEIGHPNEVGVNEPGQHCGLLAELLPQLIQHLGTQPRLRDHFLERDGHAEAHIPSPIDGAHAALPQERYDSIASLQYVTGC